MADDNEILFKVAADLSQLKPQFQDLTDYWKKHIDDISKGEKAMTDYAKNTEASYKKVNNVIKENITQVTSEAKAIEKLEKQLKTVDKANTEAFDDKEVKKFDEALKRVSKDIGNLDQFEFSTEDLDELTKKLGEAEDDFDSLVVLVDFFDRKMKEASVSVAGSVEDIQKKIQETQLNIKSTEDFLKEINDQIDSTAPGKVQAGLVQEREAAKKALREETVALEDYKQQLKEVNQENITLETQLRRVRNEMAQLESEGKRDTERWEQLRDKASEYSKAIKDTNEELKRSTSDTKGLDSLIGAMEGLVGVFAVAEGAQALFGDQNEELEKTLVKVTGAIALLNGLQAIQNELVLKGTLANKAYTAITKQWAIVTDSSAKATLRLKSALNLLGIGLLVTAVAALVTHWRDIAKWLGVISEDSERLNNVNKKANDLYGDQISKLKILTKQVQDGGLSFRDKAKAVETYNKELGDTFGTVKTYTELEKRLIEQGDAYIEYLGLKATAEAAYQLAIEKTKEALLKRTQAETSTAETNFLDNFSFSRYGSTPTAQQVANTRANREASELEGESDALLAIQRDTLKQMEELAKKMGLVLANPTKDLEKDVRKMSSLFEELIKKQRQLQTELIENDRDREKTALSDQLEEEKAGYLRQINELKLAEDKKQKLRDEFNRLYNEKTGLAYEKLRKDLQAIDDKYDSQLEQVQLKALNAIDAVIKGQEQSDRQAIIDKWDAIRDELRKQIAQTNDEFQKEGLQVVLDEVDAAQNKELKDFDVNSGLDRVQREKEIAESLLSIYQENNKKIIKDEELKQLQLLQLQKNFLKNQLDVYKASLETQSEQGTFQELIDQLQTSVDPAEIESIGQKLRDAFGDDTANEILKTVAALKEVNTGISETESKIKTGFAGIVADIAEWTSSIEGFSLKLGEALGLQGEAAKEFANFMSSAIMSTVNAINASFQAEIDSHQQKIASIQETINAVEDEMDRERELYEAGYANNYELRKKDLEDLKKQKRQEQQELVKAQKRKQDIQKAELIANIASQVSNLITSATSIMEAHSKIPFVGVFLALGFIASMFAAITAAKAQAKSISSGNTYRTGLKKGSLTLKGPKHEEQGFGLYNSKTGERVAEFEDDEEVMVFNRGQRNKYRHVMDALIADAQGRADIDSTLEGYYKKSNVDGQVRGVVKHVTELTVKHQSSKEKESVKQEKLLEELVKFRDDFNKEFEGHKKERENKTESWETPDYFYIKRGKETKRYKKVKDE